MSKERLRRPRGTRDTTTVTVFAHIDPEAKSRLDELSEQLNAPKWAVLEALLRHVELDDHGRPAWWREVMPETQEDLFQQTG